MTDLALHVDNLSLRYRPGRRDALTRGFTVPFRHLRSTFQPANLQRATDQVTF